VHLLGHGITPKYAHPKWVKQYGELLPEDFSIYKGGEKRVDVTLHVDALGRRVLMGMKFTPSNFVQFESSVNLRDDLGMRGDGNGIKEILVGANINSTEKLIQLPKNIASCTKKYGDPDGMVENVLNLQKAVQEMNPRVQKKLGNSARFTQPVYSQYEGKKVVVPGGLSMYFEIANGQPTDLFEPDWSRIGTNVLIQALGGMLRLWRGDEALKGLLQFCRDFDVTIMEAAVHCEIEDAEGNKISYGGAADVSWGGSLTYPWMSKTYIGQGANFFGLGYKLLILALDAEKDGEEQRAARVALGFPAAREVLFFEGEPNLRVMCMIVADMIFERLVE
jgi:hypothetical protein